MCTAPDIPKQKAPAPAPSAPEESPSAPQLNEGTSRSATTSGIASRRRGTSGLRIRLNTGLNAGSRGSGLNVPQG